MCLIKYFFEFLNGIVSVDLRSRETRVAKQIFNSIEICALVEQMRCIGMSKRMDRYVFLNLCSFSRFPNNPLHTSWREGFSVILSIKEPPGRLLGVEVLF